MPEFWEEAFTQKGEMWGSEPSVSAVLAKDLFVAKQVRRILIPGIGYGRNAQVFVDVGMDVHGIEITPSALAIARKNLGSEVVLHEGSVTDMPFDETLFDGIFCHGLIYLLDQQERNKLLRDCYRQLLPGGWMVFTVITKRAFTWGKGTALGNDRFELFGGVKIFFYDEVSVSREFKDFGLVEVSEVQEDYPFYFIVCRKVSK
jgi:SAM-dependent methyltransferase